MTDPDFKTRHHDSTGSAIAAALTEGSLVTVSAQDFQERVAAGVNAGFGHLRWTMAKGNITLEPRDLTDPYLLLPLVAWAAEDLWATLGRVAGGVFKADLQPDPMLMFQVRLVSVTATSRSLMGLAALSAIASIGSDGNVDPIANAFLRQTT